MLPYLRDTLSELAYLTLYTGCTLVGPALGVDHLPHGHRRPVVLVPGFLGRNLSFRPLQRHLAAQGFPVFLPDFGFQVGDIDQKSRELETFLERHDLENCYVVGHSMGGWIALGMGEKAHERVRHFITLGTAHHGALASHAVPLSPAALQLRPGSRRQQLQLERALACQRLTNVVPPWDEIAFPASSCRLNAPCDVEGVGGHVRLILSRPGMDMIARLLCALDDAPHGHAGLPSTPNDVPDAIAG